MRSLKSPVADCVFSLANALVLAVSVILAMPVHAARVTYEYDDGGRLKKATYPDTSATNYKLDPAGNRTNVTVSLPDTTAPSSPGAVSFSGVTYNAMTVSWGAATDNVGVAGYDYQVNSGAWQSLGNVLTTNLTGLTGSTSYTVRVRARDAAGNVSATPSSNTTTTPATPDTTLPSSPGAVSFSGVTHNAMTVNWGAATDNVGVTGYDYQVNGGGWQTLGNVLTRNLTGLSASTSYTVQVRARDAAGNVSAMPSSNTTTTPAAPDTTAPSVPTGLSATAASSQQINLSWNASTDTGGSGLAGYRVYRNGSHIASPTGTSYSDTGLSPNTTYNYTVAAIDGATNLSSQSGTVPGTTQPDTTAPSVPTGLSATASSSQQINLSWNASTDTGGSGLAGYRVYRNGSHIASPTGTSYSDTGLSPNTTYNYTVAAIDGATNLSSQSGTVPGTTQPDTTAPSVPTGLSATAVASQQINLTWTASTDTGGSGLMGYFIHRNGVLISFSPTNSFSSVGLTPNTTYTHSITAVDNANNISGESFSASATTPPDTTAPSAPTGFSGTGVSPSQINLSWNASTDAGGSGLAGYRIFRNGTQVTTTTSTSYSDTGLAASTSYNYAVQAYDGAGNSSSSSTTTASTQAMAPVPGSLQFAVSMTEPVDERSGWISIYVHRVGASGAFGPASATCSTSDGNAIAGVDYVPTSQPLTWAAGDAAPKLCWTSSIDETMWPAQFCTSTGEPGGPSVCLPWKAFIFNLSNASGASLGSITKALGVIVDDEYNF